MATTIDTINVGGVDKEIEDSFARKRIENIIAGDAPSAAEVIDARMDIYSNVDSSLGAAIRNQFNLSIMPRGSKTGSVNFNELPIGVCRVYSTTNPQNSPVGDPFGYVLTTKDAHDGAGNTQIYIGYRTREAYIRFSTNAGWQPWYKFSSGIFTYGGSLTGSNVDFNNLSAGYYKIFSTTNPQNSPVEDPFGYVLVTVDDEKYSGNSKTQIYFSYRAHQMYIRFSNNAGSWDSWSLLNSKDYDREITINPGDDLYTIMKNIDVNTHVIINPGTYDISSQVSVSSDTDYTSDIHIKSGCWIEGRGMPTIICNLDSKREKTSVFFFDYGDGKLSGVNINARNTRYAIHDDTANNDLSIKFSHIIEDCMVSYEGIIGDDASSGRCIGGGIGANVTNIIRNCIFKADTNYHPVDYHTSSVVVTGGTVVAPGKVVIKDNYFVSGSARVRALSEDTGAHRDVAILTGNHGTSQFIVVNNTSNTVIPYIWNNEVIS